MCISIAHTRVTEPHIQLQAIHGPDMVPEREGSIKVFIVIIWVQQKLSSSSRSLYLWEHHMLVINHTLLIDIVHQDTQDITLSSSTFLNASPQTDMIIPPISTLLIILDIHRVLEQSIPTYVEHTGGLPHMHIYKQL